MRRNTHNKKAVTVTEVRRNFGTVVQRLLTSHEPTIIESSGIPIAVLVSIAEYERLSSHKRIAVHGEFARRLGQEVEGRGLSEEDLLTELEETKRIVFAERYGRVG